MSLELDNILDASGDHCESIVAAHHEFAQEDLPLSSIPPARSLQQCRDSLARYLRPERGVVRSRPAGINGGEARDPVQVKRSKAEVGVQLDANPIVKDDAMEDDASLFNCQGCGEDRCACCIFCHQEDCSCTAYRSDDGSDCGCESCEQCSLQHGCECPVARCLACKDKDCSCIIHCCEICGNGSCAHETQLLQRAIEEKATADRANKSATDEQAKTMTAHDNVIASTRLRISTEGKLRSVTRRLQGFQNVFYSMRDELDIAEAQVSAVRALVQSSDSASGGALDVTAKKSVLTALDLALCKEVKTQNETTVKAENDVVGAGAMRTL